MDQTLSTPAENLALDEALLAFAEQGHIGETLRLWDARSCFVVLGRSSRIQEEVRLNRCELDRVAVLRRISGGATILADRGCLFYAVLLSLDLRPQLKMLDQAHHFVMSRVRDAVAELRQNVKLQGTCDLTLNASKISGNSLRVTKDWVLYHGTLLLEMDLGLVGRYLKHPPREPEYRAGREHRDFLENMNLSREQLAESLRRVWQAKTSFPESQLESMRGEVQRLVQAKYLDDAWTFSR